MKKFKIGDRVRKTKLSNPNIFINITDVGSVGTITEILVNNTSDYIIDYDDYSNRELYGSDENLELVESPLLDLIVHCPTEELWNRVQEKMFEFTEWIYDGKEISNSWAEYGFNIIYSLKENNYKMLRGYKEYFNQTNYPDTPIISAEEYLDEKEYMCDFGFSTTYSNRCTEATLSSKNLQNAINYLTNQDSNKSLTKKHMLNKITSKLKRVLNKDLQAQYKVGYINGGLELTQDGKNALLSILAVEKEKELGEDARELVKEIEADKE